MYPFIKGWSVDANRRISSQSSGLVGPSTSLDSPKLTVQPNKILPAQYYIAFTLCPSTIYSGCGKSGEYEKCLARPTM